MIDNKTTNKQYPLPNPANIASQDVGRIATAIGMIDSDMATCEALVEATNSSINNIQQRALHIPTDQIGVIDPELKDLSARKYLVVNSDASGFTTVEGGGGEGGIRGDVLVKNSDANFDTKWVDPRAILKQSGDVVNVSNDYILPNNGVAILSDSVSERTERIPRQGISPRQSTSDIIADPYVGYILKDTIEESTEDDNIATTEKLGRVRVGTGININNGVISVPEVPIASSEEFGLVKIGSGLSVSRGVVSATEVVHATNNDFGIVKLSSDFTLGANDELLLANKKEQVPIIYQEGKIEAPENNTLVLKEDCARYRFYVTQDAIITFDLSQIVLTDDIAFYVELYSQGDYNVTFSGGVEWSYPAVGCVVGKTIIKFEKPLFGQLRGELVYIDSHVEYILTPYNSSAIEEVQPTYISSCTGASGTNFYPGNLLGRLGTGGWGGIALRGYDDYGYMQIMFMKWTCCTKLLAHSGVTVEDPLILEGSIDGENWLYLGQATVSNTLTDVERKGFFRYFRFKKASSSANGVDGMYLYGYSIGVGKYTVYQVVPYMTANEQNNFLITSNVTPSSGNLYSVSQYNSDKVSFGAPDATGYWWIKYELPEATIANLLLYATGKGTIDYFPLSFTLEGSNDDDTWTLLLRRQYASRRMYNMVDPIFFNNSTPYKYYKLTVLLTTNAAGCDIAQCRLFRAEDGDIIYDNLHPALTSLSQDGYEISASSNNSSSWTALNAFNGHTSGGGWASAEGALPAWLQLKFPMAVVCDSVAITSRTDWSYVQSPNVFEIQGSNDGEAWQTLHSVSGSGFNALKQRLVFNFDNLASFQYYRVYVTEAVSASTVSLDKIEFLHRHIEYAVEI